MEHTALWIVFVVSNLVQIIFRLSTASRKKKLENCKLNEHTDGVMVGGAALLAKEDDGLA